MDKVAQMPAARDAAFDSLQHELAVLTRRAEHVRLGAADTDGQTMERASFLLLGELAAQGPQTATALAATFRVNPSTIARQVATLVRREWVTRQRNPQAPRTTLVSITERGRRDFEQVRAARRALFDGLLADWPDADVAQLAELLGRLNHGVWRDGRASDKW